MSYAVDDDDLDVLSHLVLVHNVKTIIEFGPGRSTTHLVKLVSQIDTIEADPEYYKELKALPGVNTYLCDLLKDKPPTGLLPSYGMTFVDGPRGQERLSRIESLLFVENLTKLIVMHDAHRGGEKESIKLMGDRGWRVSTVNTARGLAVLRR
jgi:predicted O-methyltransferase YrrM